MNADQQSAATGSLGAVLRDLHRRVAALLAAHDPAEVDRSRFLRARFDAGLAWVWYPPGFGGLGLPRGLQPEVDALLAAASAPDNNPEATVIGLGMAAPAISAFGNEDQKRRFLRPLWTGEELWCQLFSEPGAGSDLAAVSTRAVRDGDEWTVNGQKVWTSLAHRAHWGILLARTDPGASKHAGLTYFLCDMSAPGVEVRALRQLTGEAEFNEVFLTDVKIPDSCRLGAESQGWSVATTTLNNERFAIGAPTPRESGLVGLACRTWREHPERRTPGTYDRLLRLWVEAEATRLCGEQLRQKLSVGRPGPEASALKLAFARIAQQASGLDVELHEESGLRYEDWAFARPDGVSPTSRDAGYRYLRARGNSIEGGTSEILRNIVAELVLGLPREPCRDTEVLEKEHSL